MNRHKRQVENGRPRTEQVSVRVELPLGSFARLCEISPVRKLLEMLLKLEIKLIETFEAEISLSVFFDLVFSRSTTGMALMREGGKNQRKKSQKGARKPAKRWWATKETHINSAGWGQPVKQQ